MSQEDATNYEVNQQHHHNQHYQGSNGRQQLTMKCENKRSAAAEPNAALYESFSVTGDKYNKKQHVAVDATENKSTTVNYEYRVVPNGTTVVNTDDVAHTAADYENLNFNRHHLQLDKKILLQKYFRTALVGPRNNIYENLCRGCNYGVFTARGPLCTFCECIVNGVTSISASPAESSNNIYENICAHCAQFYSGNGEGDECQCRKKIVATQVQQVSFRQTEAETEKDIQPSASASAASLNKVDSKELLVKDLDDKKKVKIRKSKSFNKTKPKILTNLWDTLRKHKAPNAATTASLGARKPLEIVHNVEGFEQVFHTKETFDLKKICELKRSATSCSDQHIYGRLKPRDIDRSNEDFLSTQSLIQSEQKVKRSRVSKPKFLRSLSAEPKALVKSQLELNIAQNPQYYLNASVCLWMTSLRREVLNTYHAVNTCILSLSDEDNDCLLCYPKSIPAKNLVNLSCGKAPPLSSNGGVSNRLNIYETAQNHGRNVSDHFTYYDTDESESQSWDSTEIVALRRHNGRTSISSYDSVEGQGETHRHRHRQQQQQQQQQVVEFSPSRDHYQQMVDEFKFHLQNKQMKQQQQQQQQPQQLQQKYDRMVNHSIMNATGGGEGAGACEGDGGGGGGGGVAHTDTRIPLRQAISSNHNKAKRQGMYLRLGEQHIVQNPEYERIAINNNITITHTNDSNNNDTHKQLLTYGNVTNSDVINTVTPSHLSDALLVAALEESANVSQSLKSPDTDKRLAIHERDILQAFEALLRLEKDQHQTLLTLLTSHTDEESQGKQPIAVRQQHSRQPYGVHVEECKQYPFPSHSSPVIIVKDLSEHLQLSLSLNTTVICYDKYLCLFLRYIVFSSRHNEKYKHKTQKQLLRTFQRFHSHCCERITVHSFARSSLQNSIKSKLDLMKASACDANSNANAYSSHTNRGLIAIEQRQEIPTINESFVHSDYDDDEGIKTNVFIVTEPYTAVEKTTTVFVTTPTPSENHNRKPKTPPEVPKRDPTTKLSPTTEHLPPVPPLYRTIIPLNTSSKMTVPSSNLAKNTKHEKSQEENIYQPIWKCKTVGEVQERFKTDADYYDIKELQQEKPCDSCSLPDILISEEDHSEWEPDEEFVFSSKPQKADCDKNSTIRSNRSNNSSIGTTSLSGSTITDFASSTATLASCVSTSLMHHLFRNIGIFYSLTEPKLRAFIYDYDRMHSSRYFGKTSSINAAPTRANDDDSHINDSGLGKSPTPTFANRSTVPVTNSKETLQPFKCSSSESVKLSEAKAGPATVTSDSHSVSSSSIKAQPPPVCHQIPKSVEAWKCQLLNVNYMEDEEDMIVSEHEILRAQKMKEDVELQAPAQPQIFIQRFKSRSTDNILDLPLEDDKRSFGDRVRDRVRDKLQRGILNINNKSSPKSEKRLAIRNAQTTSLYLEEGINPKYPIFAAPLIQLELNQTAYPNVPRFVVDSVEYIERKDRIVQDGLYRACGNKFSIDELKQKLSKSFIYDPKLIVADDIHTIASLLKQFFRDLPHPLIPQETYNCLARDLTLNEGVDAMRIAINEMPEPNKSTLAFLIKHLTNVAACSSSNRMNASNLAIVWGPSLFTLNEAKTYDIGRMNTLAKVLIENFNRIFHTNERLL